MSLLNTNNVIFYHSCDTEQEYTLSQDWTKGAGLSFVGAKLVSGVCVDGGDDLFYGNNYPNLANSSQFSVAFWSSGLLSSGTQSGTISIGCGDTNNVDNGIIIDKTANELTICVLRDGVSSSGIIILNSDLPTTDEYHFFVVHCQLGTYWRIYTSIDGSGFVDRGFTDTTQALTTDVYGNIHLSGHNCIDEVVLWDDVARFTDVELNYLYRLADYYGVSMNQYEHYKDIQGILRSDDAIFYHPADTPIEFIKKQSWDGSGYFVDGKIDQAMSAKETLPLASLDAQEFDSSNANTLKSVYLSDDKHVVLWQINNDLYARVIDWSGHIATSGDSCRVAENVYFTYRESWDAIDLTPSSLLIAYGQYNPDTWWRSSCSVLNVSGTTFTSGSPTVFAESNGHHGLSEYLAVTALSSTKAAICFCGYKAERGGQPGEAVIVEISGDTVTCSSGYATFCSGHVEHLSCTSVGVDQFAVVYNNLDIHRGQSCLAQVSGTTISFGQSNDSFAYAKTVSIATATIDDERTLLMYFGGERDSSYFSDGSLQIASISGGCIEFGQPCLFTDTESDQKGRLGVLYSHRNAVLIDEDCCAIAYYGDGHGGDGQLGVARIINISGIEIQDIGDRHIFAPEGSVCYWINIAKLTPSSFVVTWMDDDLGKSRVGSISGTTITYGDVYNFASGTPDKINVLGIDSNNFLVLFDDSYKLNARVGNVSGQTIDYGIAYPFADSTQHSVNQNYYRLDSTLLDSSHVLTVYPGYYLSGSQYAPGCAKILGINGTIISSGTETRFTNNDSYNGYCTTQALNTSGAICTWNPKTSSGVVNHYCAMATIDDLSISFGESVTYDTKFTDYDGWQIGTHALERSVNVIILPSGDFALVWPDIEWIGNLFGPGGMKLGSITETTPVFGPSGDVTHFGQTSMFYGPDLRTLDSTHVVAVSLGKALAVPKYEAHGHYLYGGLVVGQVSGDQLIHDLDIDILFTDETWDGNFDYHTLAVLDETHVGIARYNGGQPTGINMVQIYGLSGLIGPTYERLSTNRAIGGQKLGSQACVFYYEAGNGAGPLTLQVFELDKQGAGFTSSSPSVYPSISGCTRIIHSTWTKNPNTDGSMITITHGYQMVVSSSGISFGSGTAVWNDADISGVLSNISDGQSHLLVLEFENTDGDNWSLQTSVDGASWIDQGQQNTGSQSLITATAIPQIFVLPPSSGYGYDHWIDEIALWGGNKTVFGTFSDSELSHLYRLVNIFDAPLYQYYDQWTMVASGNLFIDGITSMIASGNLFVAAPELITTSGNVFIHGHQSTTISGSLFIDAYGHDTTACDLFIESHKDIDVSGALYIQGHRCNTTSGNLFIYGHTNVTGSIPLFIFAPPPDMFNVRQLFIAGPQPITSSGNLFIHGVAGMMASGNLYVDAHRIDFGSISLFLEASLGDSWVELRYIEKLTRSSDYHPQLVGTFDGIVPDVNIEVWDIVDGVNVPVAITNSGCYAIGNTNKWGWSTEFIPFSGYYERHYFWRMMTATTANYCGEFFLRYSERERWVYPNSQSEYLQ